MIGGLRILLVDESAGGASLIAAAIERLLKTPQI
jgi:hypothetical protein